MWQYTRLVAWSIFWLVLWPILRLTRGRGEDNCVTWAMDRVDQEGGYLVIRWTRSTKYQWIIWPHFLYLPADKHEVLEQWVPKDDEHATSAMVPRMWFEGEIEYGDSDDVKEN